MSRPLYLPGPQSSAEAGGLRRIAAPVHDRPGQPVGPAAHFRYAVISATSRSRYRSAFPTRDRKDAASVASRAVVRERIRIDDAGVT